MKPKLDSNSDGRSRASKAQAKGNGMPRLVLSYLRFSTPEQALGDSERRQIAASEKWAAERGLNIDDTLRDAGVSAFRGANRTKGALGKIISLIEKGDIPKGSYLLIENLDRLSRSDLLEAVETFIGIIRRGVVLVTLSDGREYSKDNYDFPNLVLSAAELSRGNKESVRKSELLGAVWTRKKHSDAASGKLVTARVPAWLEVENGKIVLNRQKAKVVKEIFSMALAGIGSASIARKLNERGTANISGIVQGWSGRYVLDIIKAKSTIGIYQPEKLTHDEMPDGSKQKRSVPDGEPIAGYFPSVVDEKTYYAAQQALRSRAKTGGATHDRRVNLLNGIFYTLDGNRIVAKGQISKDKKTVKRSYTTDARENGRESDGIWFPCEQMDWAILLRLSELHLNQKPADNASELKAVEGRIADIQSKLDELEQAIATKPLATLMKAIERLETEKGELEAERYRLIGSQAVPTTGIGGLFKAWKLKLDEILYGRFTDNAKRLELREAIRSHVERIDCHWEKGEKRGDYVASLRIKLHPHIRIKDTDESEIFWAFKLTYVDYRSAKYNPENPYEIEFLIVGAESAAA